MTLNEKEIKALPEFMTPADCRKFLELKSSATKLPEGIPFFTTQSKNGSSRMHRYVYRTKFIEWFKALAGVDVTPEQEEFCRMRIYDLIEEELIGFLRADNEAGAELCEKLQAKFKGGEHAENIRAVSA